MDNQKCIDQLTPQMIDDLICDRDAVKELFGVEKDAEVIVGEKVKEAISSANIVNFLLCDVQMIMGNKEHGQVEYDRIKEENQKEIIKLQKEIEKLKQWMIEESQQRFILQEKVKQNMRGVPVRFSTQRWEEYDE